MLKNLKLSFALLIVFSCFVFNPSLEAIWGPPVTISSSIGNQPQIGISDAGYAIAIWNEFDGVNTNIQSATQPEGGVWSSPVTISSSPSPAVTFNAAPQIAVNSSGYAVGIWEEFDFVGNLSVVKSSTLPLGGFWSSPVTISVPSPNSSQIPQIAIDPAGNAIAIWVRGNNTPKNIIQSATLPFEGTWSSVTDVSSLLIDSFSP